MSPSINYYCVSLTQRALYFMGKMVPNEGDGTLQIQYATLAQWESRKLIISWYSDRNTGVAP